MDPKPVEASRDLFDLSDARAVVTGAAGGIGRSAATALASYGASVTLFDLREDELQATAKAVERVGGTATVIVGDVTSNADLEALLAANGEREPVSVLLNCAGIVRRSAITEMSLADLDLLWDVNVRGTVATTLAFLPQMIELGRGKVINLGSLGSVTGLEQRTAYATSKGAVALFTRSLAHEVGRFGICVNAIAPGYMETEMTMEWIHGDGDRTDQLLSRMPLGRFGSPSDVDGLAVFLASAASDYLTGQVIMLDGGWMTS
jgi:NAD(P)-dependent dehydrogenase (short-subunit alcohol dehydrogenase family)